MPDKLKSVAEVVQSVSDGAHIALGGFAIARNVIAVAHELIRQGRKKLTVSQAVMGLDTDLLVGAGLVSKLIAGGGSLDRFGRVECINRARGSGALVALDMSSLSLTFGYLAGALGLSFIPIKSLMASEILERLERGPGAEIIRRMKCPFTGEDYLLLRAITPDVAFIHVQRADALGNAQIDGPRWENEEQAKAARRVMIIAEELVPTEYIQQSPERTIIPAHRVEAVIHQPFGAHPTAVFRCYDYDAQHLQLYVEHSRRAERVGEYLDKFVRSTRDHWEYLEKAAGLKHLEELRADRILGY
jgi:glutaconate CoA-transferase subunit A